ncbi:MAG: acetate--CoA ligase, partial [Asticcacaulis sp.]|uniref:acetate--CoA ligase n=1 Tax=Asticcacaulis sp. TaxID=1872648 RepID=UPI003F7BCEA1
MDDHASHPASAVFPVPQGFLRPGTLTAEGLQAQRDLFARDPEAHWRTLGDALDWIKPYTKVKDVSFNRDDFRIRWFYDGQLNVSANCIDRHLATRGEQVAFIFEGDDPGVSYTVTYNQLSREVNKRANLLKHYGVKKGDRVTLYLPMIPEAAYFMLACTRIGAVHSVVFGGFSPDSIAGRILDCRSDIVITANEGKRGGKTIPLKANVDLALLQCPDVRHVLVVEHTNAHYLTHDGRDISVPKALEGMSDQCEPEPMNAEDPLFILYTSGSTGKPKGVLHTTGGYLAWVTYTMKTSFDYQDGDIYWCTADVGWVTGHSYVVYGPLSNGGASLIFEGVPNYPDSSRFWQVVDKHKVTTFYTAPTAIRALMREGEAPVTSTSRASLRVLGTVGEPINPEAWLWYHRVVGNERCPIVDTWWQTETGGHLITPVPGATPLKPGSATQPLPGVVPMLVDAEGKELHGATEGNLCIVD